MSANSLFALLNYLVDVPVGIRLAIKSIVDYIIG